jgi:hypothetical protein
MIFAPQKRTIFRAFNTNQSVIDQFLSIAREA